MDVEDLARTAVDCGYHLHRDLGPGLLESVYEALLAVMIARTGVSVQRQVPITFEYDGVVFKDAFKADIIVESTLLIEVKSVEKHAPVHAKQLLTYLRLTHRPLGLLMNFGAPTFKDGVRRIVNDHRSTAGSTLHINRNGAFGAEPVQT